jgi:hypothetical protein
MHLCELCASNEQSEWAVIKEIIIGAICSQNIDFLLHLVRILRR